MEKKGIIAGVLALIAVILLGVALVGIWYVADTALGKGEAGLTQMKTTYKNLTTGETESKTMKWADVPGAQAQKALYTSTFYITIAAFVLGIIGVITAFVAAAGKFPGKIAGVGKIPGIFLILTMILALVAFAYFAAALPGAMKEDSEGVWDKGFMGSEEVMGTKQSWGPGYGWVLTIVAFVLALIGAIFAFAMPKRAAAAPAPAPPPPAAP